MTNRYNLNPMTVTKSGPTDVDFQQLQSLSIGMRTQKAELVPAGSIDRQRVSVASARPAVDIGTRDLLTFFTHVSPTLGLACTQAQVRLAQRLEANTYQTGSTHVVYTCAGGFLRPVSLRASQSDDQGASLSAEYSPLSTDGLTSPITKATASFASTPASAFLSRYFMGPIRYNGTYLNNTEAYDVQFGIGYQARMFSGSVYPTTGSIVGRRPVIQFDYTDALAAELSNLFANASAGAMEFYLRKDVQGGTRVADNVAEHVAITASSSEFCMDVIQAEENEDATAKINIMPMGTLALSLVSTIP